MKVAVTSEGATLDAAVDPRFGRAKYFILADTDADTFEAVDNVQNLNAASGAGIQSAETVVNRGAEAVVNLNGEGQITYSTNWQGQMTSWYAVSGSRGGSGVSRHSPVPSSSGRA